MTVVKDTRKVYTYQEIAVNGTVVHFDGKYNPETDTLKVYRMHGDIRLFNEALMNFCTDNKIGKAVVA